MKLSVPKQPDLPFEEILEKRPTLALRPYQMTHLAQIIRADHPRFGEFSDAGTGKTPTCCVYFYAQWQNHGEKSLWVMPNALLRKNREELLLWSEFEPDEVVMINGTPKQRMAQISYPNAKVLLCGFDAFKAHWRDVIQHHPRCKVLGVDEWHLGFSNHYQIRKGRAEGPQRTAELYQAMRYFPKLLAMTGTLVNGRLTSAYPFLQVTCPLAYHTYKNFLHWHAVLDDYGKPTFWLHHDRLSKVLSDHSVRISFSEAYGDEPVQIQNEMCEMSPRQLKAYREMETDALLELEDEFLEAENEPVKLMRCRQIMQHPQTFGLPESESGKVAHAMIHVANALDADERIVIFEVTVAGQERLVEAAKAKGARVGLINGNVSDKGAVDEAFRRHELDVVVCAPICAGIGFNWGFVNHMLFTSIDYQDTTFIQNYRRALRGERTKTLLITLLMYPNSIDQRINQIVTEKSRDRMRVNKNNDTGVRLTSRTSQAGRHVTDNAHLFDLD